MNPELKPDLDRISAYLRDEFDAQALILCGSRHVGDYKPHSDWDVKAFVEDPQKHIKENRFPQLPGVDIDCTFHTLDTQFSWDEFGLKLRFSEVVFDNDDGIARKVRDQAQEEYAKEPQKWSLFYALGRIEKAKRYEAKFQDLLEEGNHAELFQRIAFHYTENTYTWWYGARQEWEPRPQAMFKDLQARDPEFYRHLSRVFTSTDNEEKVRALHDLHEHFFSTEAFQKLIK